MTFNSVWYAFLVTLVTLVVSYPTAYFLSKTKHKNLWLLSIILPTWVNLLLKAYNKAQEMGQAVHVGNILCSEIFYNADEKAMENWIKMGVLAVEMESAALYANATAAGVNALTILTVSDSLVTGEETTPEERQTAFTKMMEIALGLA